MAGKIYVGDVGTAFRLIVTDAETLQPIDITAATSLQISVLKPNGKIVTWAANAGAGAGVVEYIAQAGDLDVAGNYQMQALVALPAWNGRSTTEVATIYAAFK